MPKDHCPPNQIEDSVVQEWLQAKSVIRQWIRDFFPDPSRSLEVEDQLAAALIARLAQQEPPLTITIPEDWS
jgi:hypothetical protein